MNSMIIYSAFKSLWDAKPEHIEEELHDVEMLVSMNNNLPLEECLRGYRSSINNQPDAENILINAYINAETLEEKAIISYCLSIHFNNIDKEESLRWKNKFNSFNLSHNKKLNNNMVDYKLKEYVASQKTLMYHYIKEYYSIVKDNSKNILVMLKGWSSSTPYLATAVLGQNCFGGGFYIRYKGVGIAVDPGCNFIKNMHRNNINILDIDYVVVTHNHTDHQADLRGLDDLNYEYNNFREGYNYFCKKHKINNNLNEQMKEHNITWYLDSETYENYEKLGENHKCVENILAGEQNEKELQLAKEPINIESNDYFKLFSFPTIHIKASYGIKIELLDKNKKCICQVGYSSDTCFYKELPSHLENSDILIANISEISEVDVKGEIDTESNHLKLQGCINLINKSNPKLCVISEFWGGKEDIRLYIIKKILKDILPEERKNVSDKLQNKSLVIPGDIGLEIDLISQKIKCSICGRYSNANEIITLFEGDYKTLKYICKSCCISPQYTI